MWLHGVTMSLAAGDCMSEYHVVDKVRLRSAWRWYEGLTSSTCSSWPAAVVLTPSTVVTRRSVSMQGHIWHPQSALHVNTIAKDQSARPAAQYGPCNSDDVFCSLLSLDVML